jgi:hypothetical protein
MSDTPTAAEGAEGPQSAEAERRARERYPRRLDMLWQVLGTPGHDRPAARMFDLSTSGIGLVFDRALAPNTVLTIRLPTATLGWNTHLVRVKNVRQTGPSEFLTGCSFVKPLSSEQLEALLI